MNAGEHLPLVRRIARQMMLRVPSNIECDDLVQAGSIGLLDAIERFESGHATGATFETFAAARIRGAMLDQLRAGDPLTRTDRRVVRLVAAARMRLEQRLLRTPTEGEVALETGLGLDEIRRLPSGPDVPLDDEDEIAADDTADPAAIFQHGQRLAALAAAVQRLPERDQFILRMRYEHDLSFVDLAITLGVSESAVSRAHLSIVTRLRARLQPW